MRLSKRNILVEFEEPKEVSGLVVPERYLIQEGDETDSGAWGVTTDRSLINPQVCRNIETDERLFVHYGAYEVAKWPKENMAIIPEGMVLFYLDPVRMVPGTYLGDYVWTEDKRTDGGIILEEGTKQGLLIKLAHICEDSPYSVGDTVITYDDRQYELRFEDKTYIKLTDDVIIGKMIDREVHPVRNCLLVKYIPDADLQERKAENDRRASQRDFLDKHYMHYTVQDFEPLPEPRTAMAKVIRGNASIAVNETVVVLRNIGALMPDGTSIVSMDTVLGVVTGELEK